MTEPTDDPKIVAVRGSDGVLVTGETGETGEDGARGSRGHSGHDGSDGLDGERGREGRDGRAGLDFTPVRSRTGEVLKALSVLCGIVVVIMALSVVIARQGTIDHLRQQLDDINDDRRTEQLVENCRDLYEEDVLITEAAYVVAEGELILAIAGADEAAVTDAVTELDAATQPLLAAVRAFVAYTTADPAPGQCEHTRSTESD